MRDSPHGDEEGGGGAGDVERVDVSLPAMERRAGTGSHGLAMQQQRTARRLKQHCPETWAAFYRAHVEAVWQFSHRRLRGRHDEADEVTSETFLAAVESIDRYDPRAGPPQRWLFGIARRKLADKLRQTYRHRLRLTDHDLDTLPGTAPMPGRDDDTEATGRRVARILQTLSAQQRDILLWMYREALSVRQIAERLNRTEKAAENLLYRARVRFRQAYQEALNDEMEVEPRHETRRPIAQADR